MNDIDRPSIRWQEIRIIQFNFVTYILLILCIGLFAFQLDTIIQDKINNNRELFMQSVYFIFLSIFFGCILGFNRLIDFKLTAKITRKKEKNDNKHLSLFRKITKNLGRITWILLSLQLLFFLFGVYKLLSFILN